MVAVYSAKQNRFVKLAKFSDNSKSKHISYIMLTYALRCEPEGYAESNVKKFDEWEFFGKFALGLVN